MSSLTSDVLERPLFASLSWKIRSPSAESVFKKTPEREFRQVIPRFFLFYVRTTIDPLQRALVALQQRVARVEIYLDFAAVPLQDLTSPSRTSLATQTDTILLHAHVIRLADTLLLQDPPLLVHDLVSSPFPDKHHELDVLTKTLGQWYSHASAFRKHLPILTELVNLQIPRPQNVETHDPPGCDAASSAITLGYKICVPSLHQNTFLLKTTIFADLLRTYLVCFQSQVDCTFLLDNLPQSTTAELICDFAK